MKNHTSCITESPNANGSKDRYCQCEVMNNPSELIVEVAKGAGSVMQYDKLKRKFFIHAKDETKEFNQDRCPFCKQEIATLCLYS